jgi:hypothetical protein
MNVVRCTTPSWRVRLECPQYGSECAHAADAHVRAIASVAAMRQAALLAFFVLTSCVRSSANDEKGGVCSSSH